MFIFIYEGLSERRNIEPFEMNLNPSFLGYTIGTMGLGTAINRPRAIPPPFVQTPIIYHNGTRLANADDLNVLREMITMQQSDPNFTLIF